MRRFTFELHRPPLDLGGYLIRYAFGVSTNWAAMTPLHSGALQYSPWETVQLAAGAYTFAVKAIDTSGNESANATFLSKTLAVAPHLNTIAQRSAGATAWAGSQSYA